MNPTTNSAFSGMRNKFLLAALIAAPNFAWAASNCINAETAAHTAIEAQRGLQHAPGDKRADDGQTISAQQRTAIRIYKDALVGAIDARLACADARVEPVALQRALKASLGVGKTPSAPDSSGDLGEGLDVAVTRSADPGPLLLVRAGFGIPCGDDNVLVVFAWDGAIWQQVLRWQSGEYDQISGAFGDTFQYAVLPGGQIAVAHGGPWCSSRWRSFGLDVLALASGTQPQRTVFHLQHRYAADFDAEDDGLTLKRRADGLELRTSVSSLDGDLITRKAIFRYRFAGDAAERIQPAAVNGRDFVDEWLVVDEASARNWSDPNSAALLLKARRAVMHEIRDESTVLNYGPVRACSSGPDRYQVEIDLRRGNSNRIKTHYGLVRQERNGFTMLSLGDKADSTCSGADLMRH
jgi:hypothetical protein